MKKRVLSLLLVVAMLASLVVFPAYATGTECACGCGATDVEWEPWTGKLVSGKTHYILEEDVVAPELIIGGENSSTYAFNLNGHVWRAAAGSERVLKFGTNANATTTITILDTSTDGTGEMQSASVTGQSGGVVYVGGKCTLNLKGGTLRMLYDGDIKPSYAGVLRVVNNATVNMYDGSTITDGDTSRGGSGVAGNVRLQGGTFNMYGGKITNGMANTNGGGVYINADTTFNMSGGEISGNASSHATAGNGGNIYNAGTLNISGDAVIKNGVVSGQGANIYNVGTMTLDGVTLDGDIYTTTAPVLKGAVTINMGNSNGLLLASGVSLDASQMDADNSKVYFGINWAEDAVAGDSVAFTGNDAAAYQNCFLPVATTTNVEADETDGFLSVAKIADGETSYCPHCGEGVDPVAWTSVSEEVLPVTTGHYFLGSNVTTNYTVSTAGDIVLNLNGFTDTVASALLYKVSVSGVTVSILDTIGGGALVSTWTSSASTSRGGILSSNADSYNTIFNVYSGTLRSTGSLTAGGVITNRKGQINIYGGILRGGKVTGGTGGGVIWTHTATGGVDINISGGLLVGGTAAAGVYGGNILVGTTSRLKITGGIITGGTSGHGGSITINSTGANSISNCVIRGGSNTAGSTTYGFGANVCMKGTGTLTMDNVTVAGGNSSAMGGNIGVGNAAVAGFTMKNVTVYGGTAATNGGNVWLEKTAAFTAEDCMIFDGYAVSGGNIYLRNTNTFDAATFTNCVISNGTAGDLEADADIRSDNIWTGVGVTLDSTKIYGTSGLNNIGSGIEVRNSGSTHKETIYVTLKGDTQIGTAEHPFDASLHVRYGTYPAQVVIDSSFTGTAVLSPDGLMSYTAVEETAEDGTVTTTYTSNFDPNDAYGKTLVYATCNGAFEGKLYLGNHKASDLTVYEYGMPAITTNDGETLVVDAAGAIVNGKHYDLATALDMVKDKDAVLKAVVTDLTLEDGTYYIDVNGKNVNVSGAGTVYGIDTATDDHANAGTGTLVAADGVTVKAAATDPVTGEVYIRVLDTVNYEFHHIDMDITSVVLRTSNAGIYYKGTWDCDSELAQYITEQGDNILYGVVASIDGTPEDGFNTDETCRWSYKSGAAFAEEKNASGVLITGILKDTTDPDVRTEAENVTYCNTSVNAKAYLMVTEDNGDKSYIVGQTGAQKSMMDMFIQIDKALSAEDGASLNQSHEAVKTLMTGFYGNWAEMGLKTAIDAEQAKEGGHQFANIFTTTEAGEDTTEETA